MKKIEICDVTLRDGAQGEGINFSIEDKIGIITVLDRIGVDIIEAGAPGSNPKDMGLFKKLAGMHFNSKLSAFGQTRKRDNTAENDAQLAALLESEAEILIIYGKSHILHAEKVLKATPEQNIDMVSDSISYLRSFGRRVFFDAEHFFDGYKYHPDYSIEVIKAAATAGAERIILCDTNGGCFPNEISEITEKVCAALPDAKIGIHCHNDMGLAVACSLEACKVGAYQLQGSFTGFGERCGNTPLCQIIPSLQLKLGYDCIPEDGLRRISIAARYIADISNLSLAANTPYVGSSAFTHKAGTHVDAMRKLPGSYEHVEPELVGNERRYITSEMAGKSAIYEKIEKFAPEIKRDSPIIGEILADMKKLEMQGWLFESAEASLELMVLRKTEAFKNYFQLAYFKVSDNFPMTGDNGCIATIKIAVASRTALQSAEGDGPIHALDTALRSALAAFYPEIANIRLIDYKVRVLTPNDATAARVRVLMNSTDGVNVWSTVGVSRDIIRASWKALCDSVEYHLYSRKVSNRNIKP